MDASANLMMVPAQRARTTFCTAAKITPPIASPVKNKKLTWKLRQARPGQDARIIVDPDHVPIDLDRLGIADSDTGHAPDTLVCNDFELHRPLPKDGDAKHADLISKSTIKRALESVLGGLGEHTMGLNCCSVNPCPIFNIM